MKRVYKCFGEVLRDARKINHKTIKEVAGKLEISYKTMTNIESGQRMATTKQLEKFAFLYNCKFTDILSQAFEKFKNMPDKTSQEIDFFEKILKKYNNLIETRKKDNFELLYDIIKNKAYSYSPIIEKKFTQIDLIDITKLADDIINTRLEQIYKREE